MPFLLQENQNRDDEAELGFGTVTLFAVVGDADRRRRSLLWRWRTDNKDLEATLFLLSFVFPYSLCVFYSNTHNNL